MIQNVLQMQIQLWLITGISVPAVEKSSPKQTLLISPDVVKGQFRAFRSLNINHQHHNAAANTSQESFLSCSCVFSCLFIALSTGHP